MSSIVGIDLAASPVTTGVVVFHPGVDRWSAAAIEGADDDALVDVVRGASHVGVDAPLGWPDAFVAAVAAHHGGDPWTGVADRTPLRYRLTDLRTRELVGGRLPLSVSTDLLGVVGLRCALLQRRWAEEVWGEPAPRDGSGALSETYPAAAFAAWRIDSRGYKARDRAAAARSTRELVVEQLSAGTASWLDVDPIADRCVGSDHVLDALVCALVALAVAGGSTHAPSDDEREVALREGWIHVPAVAPDALDPVRFRSGGCGGSR